MATQTATADGLRRVVFAGADGSDTFDLNGHAITEDQAFTITGGLTDSSSPMTGSYTAITGGHITLATGAMRTAGVSVGVNGGVLTPRTQSGGAGPVPDHRYNGYGFPLADGNEAAMPDSGAATVSDAVGGDGGDTAKNPVPSSDDETRTLSQYLSFDGVRQCAHANNGFEVDGAGNISLEAVIRKHSDAFAIYLFGADSSLYWRQWSAFFTYTDDSAKTGCDCGERYTTAAVPNPAEFFAVTWVWYNATNTQVLYINGVRQTQATFEGRAYTPLLTFGSAVPGWEWGDYFSHVDIALVKTFKGILTDDDVAASYAASRADLLAVGITDLPELDVTPKYIPETVSLAAGTLDIQDPGAVLQAPAITGGTVDSLDSGDGTATLNAASAFNNAVVNIAVTTSGAGANPTSVTFNVTPIIDIYTTMTDCALPANFAAAFGQQISGGIFGDGFDATNVGYWTGTLHVGNVTMNWNTGIYGDTATVIVAHGKTVTRDPAAVVINTTWDLTAGASVVEGSVTISPFFEGDAQPQHVSRGRTFQNSNGGPFVGTAKDTGVRRLTGGLAL